MWVELVMVSLTAATIRNDSSIPLLTFPSSISIQNIATIVRQGDRRVKIPSDLNQRHIQAIRATGFALNIRKEEPVPVTCQPPVHILRFISDP
jgi:hypothetical protein